MSDQEPQATESAAVGSVDARLARPGAITYLHIPADDVRRAAAFYGNVFGWKVDGADSDRPSFDDAGGHVSGAWMRDHPASREPGLLPYIYVEDVEETARQVVAHGGEIVLNPFPEGRLTVATFRDPAGNVIGLWHDDAR
jgi:predicted enzyme related to lactoylglutathione lyase